MRVYEDDPLVGEQVERRAPVLRKLVGRTVDFLEHRWHRKRTGVIDEVSGRNICIDNNWYWLPDIRKMTVHPEEVSDGT